MLPCGSLMILTQLIRCRKYLYSSPEIRMTTNKKSYQAVYFFRNYFGWFSCKPHFTGQQADTEIATSILNWFRELHLEVSISNYNTLLSFPRRDGTKWEEDEANKV